VKFLGIFLLFSGYALVYASVAAGGKYATEPWLGLFVDAYTDVPIINVVNVAPGTPGAMTIPGLGLVAPPKPLKGIPSVG